MTPVRIAVVGATGRTGGAVVRLAAATADVTLAAALVPEGDARRGRDVGPAVGVELLGVVCGSACDVPVDVVVDFSTPSATVAWARWAAERGVAVVSGTTGLSAADHAVLDTVSERVPLVWAPNMSIGVNLLLRLTNDVARTLHADWDVEIVEAHHRHKVDAPSGTARALYEQVCAAQGHDPDTAARHGRTGQVGARSTAEIGLHAIRMGSVVGEHDVHFCSDHERVTLHHSATSRDAFAAGALRAATWIVGRPAGRYDMADVLFSTR